MPISDEVIELAPVSKTKKKVIPLLVSVVLCAALAITFLVLYLIKPSVTEEQRIVNSVTATSNDLFIANENGQEVIYASVGKTYTINASISVEKDTGTNVQWEWNHDAVTRIDSSEGGKDNPPAFFSFKPNASAAGTTTEIKVRSQSNSNKTDSISFIIVNQGAEDIRVTKFGTQNNLKDVTDSSLANVLSYTLPYYTTRTNNKQYTVRFEQFGKYNPNTGEYSQIAEGADTVKVASSEPDVIRINNSTPSHFTFDILKGGSSVITVTANEGTAAEIKKTINITVQSNNTLGYVDSFYFFNKPVVNAQFIYKCLDTSTKTNLDANNIRKTVDEMNRADPSLDLRYSAGTELILPYSSSAYSDIFSHIMLNPINIQYVAGNSASTVGELRDKWSDNITVSSSAPSIVRATKDSTTGLYRLTAPAFDTAYSTDRCTITFTDSKNEMSGVKTEVPVRVVAKNTKAAAEIALDGASTSTKDNNGFIGVTSVPDSTWLFKLDYELTLNGSLSKENFITNKYINDSYILMFESDVPSVDFDDVMEVTVGTDTTALAENKIYSIGKAFEFIQRAGGTQSNTVYDGNVQFKIKLKPDVADGTYTLVFKKIGSEPSGVTTWDDLSWTKRLQFAVTRRADTVEMVSSEEGTAYIQNNAETFVSGYYVKPTSGSSVASIYVQNRNSGTSFPFNDEGVMRHFLNVNGNYDLELQCQRTGSTLRLTNGRVEYTGTEVTSIAEAATVTAKVTVAGQQVGEQMRFKVYLYDAVDSFERITDRQSQEYTCAYAGDSVTPSGSFTIPTALVKVNHVQQTAYSAYVLSGMDIYYGGESKNPARKLTPRESNDSVIYSYTDPDDGSSTDLFSYTAASNRLMPLVDLFAFSVEKGLNFNSIVLEFLLSERDSEIIRNTGKTFVNNSNMRVLFVRLADGAAIYDNEQYNGPLYKTTETEPYSMDVNQDQSVDLYVSSLIKMGAGADDYIVARKIPANIVPTDAVSHALIKVPSGFLLNNPSPVVGNSYYDIHFQAPIVSSGDSQTHNGFALEYKSRLNSANNDSKPFELLVHNAARGIASIAVYTDSGCTVALDGALDFGVYLGSALVSRTFYVEITYQTKTSSHTHFERANITVPSYLELDTTDARITEVAGRAGEYVFQSPVAKLDDAKDSFTCVLTLKEGENTFESNEIKIEQQFGQGNKVSAVVNVSAGSGLKELVVKENADKNISQTTVLAGGTGSVAYTFTLADPTENAKLELELDYSALASAYGIGYNYKNSLGVAYPSLGGLTIGETVLNDRSLITISVDNANLKKLSECALDFVFTDRAGGAASGNTFTVRVTVSVKLDVYSVSLGESGQVYSISTKGVGTGKQTAPIAVTLNGGLDDREPEDNAVEVFVVKDGVRYNGEDIKVVKSGENYSLEVADTVVKGTGYAVRAEYVKNRSVYAERGITISTLGHTLSYAEGNTVTLGADDSSDLTIESAGQEFTLAASVANMGTEQLAAGKKATYKLYSDAALSSPITDGSITIADGVIKFNNFASHGTVYYTAEYSDTDGEGATYNTQKLQATLNYYVKVTSVNVTGVDGAVLSGKAITLYLKDTDNYSFIDLSGKLAAYSVALNGNIGDGVTFALSSSSSDIAIDGMRIIPRAISNGATVSVTATYHGVTTQPDVYTVRVNGLPQFGSAYLVVAGELDVMADNSATVTANATGIAGYTLSVSLTEKTTALLNITDNGSGEFTVKLNGKSSAHVGAHTVICVAQYTIPGYVQGALSLTAEKTLNVLCTYTPEFDLWRTDEDGRNPVHIDPETAYAMTSAGKYELRISDMPSDGGATFNAIADGVVSIGTIGADGKAVVTLLPDRYGAFTVTVTAVVYGQTKTADERYNFTYGANPSVTLYYNTNGTDTFATELEGGAIAVDFATIPVKFKYVVSDIDLSIIPENGVDITVNGDVTVGETVRDTASGTYYVIITADKSTARASSRLIINGSVTAGTRIVYLPSVTAELTATAPTFTLERNGGNGILPGASADFTFAQTAEKFKGGTTAVYSIASGESFASIDGSTGRLTAFTDISSDSTVTVRATITVNNGVFKGTYTVYKDITIKGVALPDVAWKSDAATRINIGATDYSSVYALNVPADYASNAVSAVISVDADGTTLGSADYSLADGTLTIRNTATTRAGGKIRLRVTATVGSGNPHAGQSVYDTIDVTIVPTLADIAAVTIANGAGDIDFNSDRYKSAITVNTSASEGGVQANDAYSVIGLALGTGAPSAVSVNGSKLVLSSNITTEASFAVTVSVRITGGVHAGTELSGTMSVSVAVPTGVDPSATWNAAGNIYSTVTVDNSILGIAGISASDIASISAGVVNSADAGYITVANNNTSNPAISVAKNANIGLDDSGSARPVDMAYTVRLNNGDVYYSTSTLRVAYVKITLTASLDNEAMPGVVQRNVGDEFTVEYSADKGFELSVNSISVTTVSGAASSALTAERSERSVRFVAASAAETLNVTVNLTVAGIACPMQFQASINAAQTESYFTADSTAFTENAKGDNASSTLPITSIWTYNGGSSYMTYNYVDSITFSAPTGRNLSDIFSSIAISGGQNVTALSGSTATVDVNSYGNRVQKTTISITFTLKTGSKIDLTTINASMRAYYSDRNDRYYRDINIRYTFRVVDDVTVSFETGDDDVTVDPITVKYKSNYNLPTDPVRTGYVFRNWYASPDFSGEPITEYTEMSRDVNHTLYAKWDAGTYTVTYGSNSKVVTYGETYGTLDPPAAVVGKSFVGWKSGGEFITANSIVSITASTTLIAEWSDNSYAVDFKSENVSIGSTTVIYGGKYGAMPTPSAREGYTFDGWYTAENGGGTQITDNSDVTLTSEPAGETITLYAKWTAVIYRNITLDANGGTIAGSASYSVRVVSGDPFDRHLTIVPVRNGYAFDGWYNTESQKVTTGYDEVTEDITLTAHWIKNEFTVTVDFDGGKIGTSDSAAFTVKNGDRFGLYLMLAPTKSGYEFDHWYIVGEGDAQTPVTGDITVENDMTVYAAWKVVYTVSFNANYTGAPAVESKKYHAGDTYGNLPPLERTGYRFDGWFTQTSGGNAVQSTDEVTATVTLIAHWTQYFTVTLDAAGGSFTGETTYRVADGESFSDHTSITPTRNNYRFDGWYNGSQNVTASAVAVNADTTLTAHWTRLYTVTYELNGGTGDAPAESDKTTGATFAVASGDGLNNPGMEFAGWSDGTRTYKAGDTYTVGENNVTLTAQWAQLYTVTYELNDDGAIDTPESVQAVAGATVTLPAGLRHSNNSVLVGWSDGSVTYDPGASYTVPEGGITLTAVWGNDSPEEL